MMTSFKDITNSDFVKNECISFLKDYFDEDFLNELKEEKNILLNLYNLFSK